MGKILGDELRNWPYGKHLQLFGVHLMGKELGEYGKARGGVFGNSSPGKLV